MAVLLTYDGTLFCDRDVSLFSDLVTLISTTFSSLMRMVLNRLGIDFNPGLDIDNGFIDLGLGKLNV